MYYMWHRWLIQILWTDPEVNRSLKRSSALLIRLEFSLRTYIYHYQQEISRKHPKSPSIDAEQNFIDPGKKIEVGCEEGRSKDLSRIDPLSTSVVKSQLTFS